MIWFAPINGVANWALHTRPVKYHSVIIFTDIGYRGKKIRGLQPYKQYNDQKLSQNILYSVLIC